MMDVVAALAFVLIAAALTEVALGGRKVQTGLVRAVGVWAAIGLSLAAYAAAVRGSGALVFLVFWGGAFLSWFGIRSHLESSILLRMVYLLRPADLSGDQLLAAYDRFYGPQQRIDELLRSGLAERIGAGLRLTSKGRSILRAAQWLRGDELHARPAATAANDTSGGG